MGKHLNASPSLAHMTCLSCRRRAAFCVSCVSNIRAVQTDAPESGVRFLVFRQGFWIQCFLYVPVNAIGPGRFFLRVSMERERFLGVVGSPECALQMRTAHGTLIELCEEVLNLQPACL